MSTVYSPGHRPCLSFGIQARCSDPVMLCDRPGTSLAVRVNPDQSPPLLDGQRHQHVERSQYSIQSSQSRFDDEITQATITYQLLFPTAFYNTVVQ